jgi:hypothetical protein
VKLTSHLHLVHTFMRGAVPLLPYTFIIKHKLNFFFLPIHAISAYVPGELKIFSLPEHVVCVQKKREIFQLYILLSLCRDLMI